MELTSPPRTYKVQSSPPSFFAGHLQDGTQILIGIQMPELVMVKFDPDGNYLEIETKKSTGHGLNGVLIPSIYDDNNETYIAEMNDWLTQVDFTPGTIVIKHFFVPEREIGIGDIPDHYQEVLDHPEDFDEERRQNLQGDLRVWLDRGDFVLYWDEDYYLDKEGEWVSS